jgi:hypothetical protein
MIRQTVLFGGYDASGAAGTWATNGTVAGTYELTGFSTNLNNPLPFAFTGFNGEVFYSGPDASGGFGLWETNGTAAGTIEIGGITNSGVSGAGSGGLSPSSLTVLDTVHEFAGTVSKTLFFAGADSGGGVGLWVTNGTAAGTVELGGVGSLGISGVGSYFHPYDLIAYYPNFFCRTCCSLAMMQANALGCG